MGPGRYSIHIDRSCQLYGRAGRSVCASPVRVRTQAKLRSTIKRPATVASVRIGRRIRTRRGPRFIAYQADLSSLSRGFSPRCSARSAARVRSTSVAHAKEQARPVPPAPAHLSNEGGPRRHLSNEGGPGAARLLPGSVFLQRTYRPTHPDRCARLHQAIIQLFTHFAASAVRKAVV